MQEDKEQNKHRMTTSVVALDTSAIFDGCAAGFWTDSKL